MEIIVLVFVAWWLYCGLKGWLGSLGSTGEQASSTAAASPPPQPVTRERTAPSAEALERAGLLRDAAEARERKGELWHAAGLWAQVGDHEREARAWDKLGRPEAAARARAQARGSVERVAGGSDRQGTSARPASVSYAPQEAAAASPPPQPVTRDRTTLEAEALERAGQLREAAEAREHMGELRHAAGLWAQVGDHEREARAWDRLGRPEAAARARAQAQGSVERVAGGSDRQRTAARPASVSYAPQEAAAAQPKVEAAPRDGLVWRPSPRPRFVRLGEDPGPR